ncbi:MAG TPA: UDP-glucose/GDP-mannose dehydrogenase family protein [Polyangiaceae bacterium]|nr:UDP-glucose/GDP-mannose dehydrogenase family protein [Polyangiaceae bacterium]
MLDDAPSPGLVLNIFWMRIAILGSGYVGLVTAAGLSEMGHHVLCTDVNQSRVEALRKGRVPFFEPGLAELVARNVKGKRLEFAARIEEPYLESDVYFIAVGTPPGEGGRADLTAVFAAAETIARSAAKPAVLAVKSTVPVGTCDEVEARTRNITKPGLRVASNPEFLKEGAALEDFFRPDRVLIGVNDKSTEEAMRGLYRPLQLSSERVLVVDRRSAELAKYAANAMLAVRISFMNELSQLCDTVGADIGSIRRAMGSDRRIGPHFLYAGPGYGGSCFPKDVSAAVALAEDHGQTLGIVRSAAAANERQRAYLFEKLMSLFPEGVRGKTIAIWGLAFKPETDDVRESPAGELVARLIELGANVQAHDPEAAANFAAAYAPSAKYYDNEYDCIDGADALVVMTEWRHFRNPDLPELKRRMRGAKIVDARNIWAMFELNQQGFDYRGIGTAAGRPK